VDLLSFPFRLAPTGTVVTVPQGSATANAEQIATLMSTIPGENTFYPTFGLTDPTGAYGLDQSELAAKVAQFGPTGVTIQNVAITYPSEHESNVAVTFTD
jgi:hypothetical protein